MRRLLTVLLTLLLCATLATGALLVLDVIHVEDVLHFLEEPGLDTLQAMWEDTAQLALDGGSLLVSRLADHTPPQGEGHALEGEEDLPEDPLQDEEIAFQFAAEVYPYRAMLNSGEQQAYDQVYANAVELYAEFPLRTFIPTASIPRVMSALFYDHPELFWLETAYQYTYNSADEVVAVSLVFNDTAENIETHRKLFQQATWKVVTQAKAFLTPIEQEKFVHDYLLDNVTYQLDAPLNQSAYSALVSGESVCAGYARAFQHILIELGIPCYYCVGYAGESHAWNIVGLDDGFYHVDVAWDDPIGNESGRYFYNYFNLTDEEIAGDHAREDLSLQLPACNGGAYTYASYFGEAETTAATSPYSAARKPENAGFNRAEALETLEEYYRACASYLVEYGEGTHTFPLLLNSRELADQIFQLTENREAIKHYMMPAAEALGFQGYSASVSLQAEALQDGYWLLTQQVHWNGESAEPLYQPEEPENSGQPGELPAPQEEFPTR